MAPPAMGVAVIGLGIMGGAIARNLVRQRSDLYNAIFGISLRRAGARD